MVEPLAMRRDAAPYGVDGDLAKIVPLVRQAVELGADVIKCDPTDDPDDFHRVVEVAGGRPVLVRGGGGSPTTRSSAAPRPCWRRARRASSTGGTSSSTPTPPASPAR